MHALVLVGHPLAALGILTDWKNNVEIKQELQN